MSGPLSTFFGALAGAMLGLAFLRKAMHGERWSSSQRFRYETIWMLTTLVFAGALLGFIFGNILTPNLGIQPGPTPHIGTVPAKR
jgi:hypothetical protein